MCAVVADKNKLVKLPAMLS